MSNTQKLPEALSEYDNLLSLSTDTLDAFPCAVFLCNHEGWGVRHNTEAARLWGRVPVLGRNGDQFCGAYQLFLPDGTPLSAERCPLAKTVKTGVESKNSDVVFRRPDGTRVVARMNTRVLRDKHGAIQGAISFFQDVSPHHALTNELVRKSADLEDFFDNSVVGLHIVSGDGIILRANKAELSLLGYTADEYIGRRITDFHVDAFVIGDILGKLGAGESLESYPARLRTKSGGVKHVLITSNARFESGKLFNTRCFTIDVTDIHAAETARRESDDRLHATYQAANIGIAEADIDGRLLRVNDALCGMLGRTREQLLAMTFLGYTHAEAVEEDADLYARQVAGELDHYVLRKRAFKADGETVYLDIHSSSVRDPSGNFRYGVRVIQDVTIAHRMEQQVRESEQHLRNLLEALPAAVYTTDAEGRIAFYNRACVELAGRTPQVGDMWCITWRLLNTDESPLPHDKCPMAMSLKESRPIRGAEAIAERPDGTRVPFIPYPTPLYDARGTLVGGINVLVDITERKRAENNQKVLIDELNHRVKNTLATVQSLAAQAARNADTAEQGYQRFEARLLALSRAHNLLTKRHWGHSPLDSLVYEVIVPVFGHEPGPVCIMGPPIKVSSHIALNLTMTLNELAINALKHGALTVATGRVSISWTTHPHAEGALLSLEWREHGGPQVIEPKRRGLGLRLIERCIQRDLDGTFEVSFHSDGIVCRISFLVGATKH
ncbi:PAS domain S-box protein [Pseudomonas sp. 102515]|uniref:PAS domain-containing sensor histidine kinase n=1 Tax=Pseudomonas sp. 102515 TaxID=3071568 RepID=UPI0028023611|nr:PAS domain S-box protein [Pseudomonas sp. 102515]MDQ7912343.1 PAS domain S-box protein [Pseudomonas sp. 102515]